MEAVKRFFGFQKVETTIGTEVRAGLSTFMTMAYILAVQPLIMSACGMPAEAVFTSTALFSGLATLLMGVYGKFPFALATAMGTNAIFAFSIVAPGLATWEQALGMIFISGVAFILLSYPILGWLRLFGVKNEKVLNFCMREAVTKHIPIGLKLGLGVAIGVFLLNLGLGANGMGLVTIADNALGLGDVTSLPVLLGIAGLLITACMYFLRGKFHVPGAILIGILLTTALALIFGVVNFPEKWVSLPPSIASIAFKLDILGALQLKYLPYIFIFFLGDFFSTAGTALACGAKAGFLDKKTGDMPGLDRVFQVDSLFTVIGAVFGLSTITTYVESAAGVEEGGRTGLTAVVVAILFFIALFLAPFFLMIPPIATGVALTIVGISMMCVVKDLPFTDPVEYVPVLFMWAITAFTGDFATALCAALVVYGVMAVVRFAIYDHSKKVAPMTYVLTLMALSKFIADIL